MIYLVPDKKIKESYPTVDFDVLAQICNTYFDAISNNPREYVLNIIGVPEETCFYVSTNKSIYIKIFVKLKGEGKFLSYFLHEFRHFIQDKGLHIQFNKKNYDETTTYSYMNSPLEVDVRLFVKENKTKFVTLYKKTKHEKHRLKTSKYAMQFNDHPASQ